MSIFSVILLGRPVNNVIATLSVLAAGLLLSNLPPLGVLVLAAIGAGFICGFGNIINDCADEAIDAVNRPDRLIPSGKLTPRQAYVSALIYLVIGLAFSSAAGVVPLCIALATAAMLVAYAFAVKRAPIVSNLWVAFMAAMTFPYAMAITGEFGWREAGLAWFGALLVFVFHVAREIIKDIEDMSGDAVGGIRTLPIMFGTRIARSATAMILALHALLVITAYPYLNLSAYYLAASCVYVVVLAVVIRRLLTVSDAASYGVVQRHLKLLMPFGLALLLIARYSV